MAAGDGAQLPAPVAASRSVEKALEEAAVSGALNLSNRRLKEFPRSARNYDLSDITHADLSKNRLCELPEELCQFMSLETLSLYHNGMRSLSSSLSNLQALTYLNLSRNLLSSLPPSVFQLPFLRVLIISNNKLCSLSASIYALTHLRQLDVSCNELQSLPPELGQLECLRDLNLRRNQLTSLPDEISELPLVRLDASCNGISHVPLCYRRLRHLQSISLDNNPLQTPPAQICSKGKYHIFKYLNMEACKRSQEELERQLRPSGFSSCLMEQELFPSQIGGLDSGFNSVESGSKRWSGNESTDDFSERSLRTAEVSRDQMSLEEEREEDGFSPKAQTVNGGGEHLDSAEGSVTEVEEVQEEEEDVGTGPPSPVTAAASEQKESSPLRQTQDGSLFRPSFYIEERPQSSPEDCPSSPSMEQRRRPETLLLWQERERLQQQQQQQQREKASVKSSNKTGSLSAPNMGSGLLASPEKSSVQTGLKHTCANAEQTDAGSHSPRMSPSTPDAASFQRSPPLSQIPKPSSFLFRSSSHSSVRPTGSVCPDRGESCTAVRSPKEERPEIAQLRKTLESQLKIRLPEDLGEALSNGTVLCQLANHVRPRSVSIIHVPSPAVPKLSTAKCRLNVENFLAACRKLGLPEKAMCTCPDVLLSNLSPVLDCVTALLAVDREGVVGGQSSHSSSPSPSLLSLDFLLFYCAAMALLCVLYCHLLA